VADNSPVAEFSSSVISCLSVSDLFYVCLLVLYHEVLFSSFIIRLIADMEGFYGGSLVGTIAFTV
jgi:hypothetical protein